MGSGPVGSACGKLITTEETVVGRSRSCGWEPHAPGFSVAVPDGASDRLPAWPAT